MACDRPVSVTVPKLPQAHVKRSAYSPETTESLIS
jgi:hypothetical protein